MARVHINRNSVSPKVVYVPDSAVGRGEPTAGKTSCSCSFPQDSHDRCRGEKGYRPPGEKPISVDGNCGRQTIAYIDFFREEGNRRNPNLPTVVDGRVDPLTSGTAIGSISGKLYTIRALNLVYGDWLNGGDRLENLSRDAALPKELMKPFFV